jgi:NAD(P)-dependent dehydrogenase (short-subunit alcohol dehydrogenase family)
MSTITPVAIITGAGSGIGRQTARALSQAGLSLVLVGRRAAQLEETQSKLADGSESLCVPADIADPSQAQAIVTSAVNRFGRLDVLINNAAQAPLKPIDQHTPDLIHQVYLTNSIAPACTIAAAWRVFKAQALQQRKSHLGACVVNVSTMGTRDPFPGFFAYAASKAAMNLMVKSCAAEGREIGVRAFAVAPGAVETDMLRSLFDTRTLPESACLSADRVAEEIAACVLGERDDKNGQVIYMSATAGVFTG